MIKPPSRGMCLMLAQLYWEIPRRTAAQKRLSWEYLFAWGFYEMYIESWFDTSSKEKNI